MNNNMSTRVRFTEKGQRDNPPIIITDTTLGTNPGKKKGSK